MGKQSTREEILFENSAREKNGKKKLRKNGKNENDIPYKSRYKKTSIFFPTFRFSMHGIFEPYLLSCTPTTFK